MRDGMIGIDVEGGLVLTDGSCEITPRYEDVRKSQVRLRPVGSGAQRLAVLGLRGVETLCLQV